MRSSSLWSLRKVDARILTSTTDRVSLNLWFCASNACHELYTKCLLCVIYVITCNMSLEVQSDYTYTCTNQIDPETYLAMPTSWSRSVMEPLEGGLDSGVLLESPASVNAGGLEGDSEGVNGGG